MLGTGIFFKFCNHKVLRIFVTSNLWFNYISLCNKTSETRNISGGEHLFSKFCELIWQVNSTLGASVRSTSDNLNLQMVSEEGQDRLVELSLNLWSLMPFPGRCVSARELLVDMGYHIVPTQNPLMPMNAMLEIAHSSLTFLMKAVIIAFIDVSHFSWSFVVPARQIQSETASL